MSGRAVIAAADCPDQENSGDLLTAPPGSGTGPATPGAGVLRSTRRGSLDVTPSSARLPRVVVVGARVLASGRAQVLRVMVRNTGRSAINAITVATLAPKGTGVVRVRGGATRNRVVTWRIPRIKAGESLALLATLSGTPTAEIDADQVIVMNRLGVAPVGASTRDPAARHAVAVSFGTDAGGPAQTM